ncbi:imidazolonepropionase-like amidohydrolase [Lipingzhangella halophila]|uniref:Imidazolonepropionase-like amidohydrolase n=1 Tax=Lipingzhangella halophila TaxID=1783352 RepID=A0A7W7RPA1_9ACTN|nr:amidohydrolase family protein [Lipingzhangella halophila]MBB4935138.1 imidazolonepropionase-like amidohydrolase [Lipingzhangella halophila]
MFPRSTTPPDAAGGSTPLNPTPAITLLRNVRVFDGRRTLDADSVLVRGEFLAAVGAGLDAPAGARVVDGAGGTVLPGLIDAHTHTMQVAELRQALAFGVTTELDMFCVPELLHPLRAAASTRTDVADIRSAGIGATAPSGHPSQLVDMGVYPEFPTLAGASEAAGFVAARAAEGSDYLKVIIEDGSTMGWGRQPHLDAATISELIAHAHARRMPVLAHISTRADALQAVDSGADGLAHLFVDHPADPEFVQRAVKAGIFAIPTITTFELLYGTSRREADYVDRPHLWPYLDPALREALLADWREHLAWQPPRWADARHTRDAAQMLHQAGMPILAGTDAAHPRTAHGLSLHAELAALVDAGLPPAAALTAATAAPAEVFGLADRGRIETGRQADLLLVAGDPTRDIAATGEIVGVWRRGHRFDREAYRAALDAGR